MRVEQIPALIECQSSNLVGVLHCPETPHRIAVVIVVGGPQYRTGSHRQFVMLARYLATRGIAVLRFDYRGMGDSEGVYTGFEHIDEDIHSAIDWICSHVEVVESVVCWGLCDAASANLMYGCGDARVAGLVLANPWVRTERTMARAYLKHYYLHRLSTGEFWSKLLRGKFNFYESLKSLRNMVRKSVDADDRGDSVKDEHQRDGDYLERMVVGWERYPGQVLVILSGRDLVADEFRDLVASSRRWKRLMKGSRTRVKELPDANHTFSTLQWRDSVAQTTWSWMADRLLECSVDG